MVPRRDLESAFAMASDPVTMYEELAAAFESTVQRVLARLGFDTSTIAIPTSAFERTADELTNRWGERCLSDHSGLHGGSGNSVLILALDIHGH